MAAFMRAKEMSFFQSLIFETLLFVCILQSVTAQSTTPSLANVTTVAATTPPPTTTTAPQGTPSPIAPDTDIPGCPCDLTGNSCDPECCCDPDCSTTDKLAFSKCLDFSYTVDNGVCYPQQIFFTENSPVISSTFNADLFCVYTDNNAGRNFYTVPELVTTQEKFDDYLSKYPQYIYSSRVAESSALPEYYRSGDPVYVVFQDRSRGTLAVPRSLGSTLCTNSNPAAFLVSESHSCVQEVPDLAQACMALSVLDAATFFSLFRVVANPNVFNQSLAIGEIYNSSVPVSVGSLLCQESSGLVGPCSFLTPPVPSFSAGTCSNALVQVTYNLVYEGQVGIQSVTVDLVFANVTAAATGSTLISQTFATNFRSSSDGARYPRSGRPGYQIGQPVVAGTLNQTTNADGTITQEIFLSQNSDQWMTVATASASGDCLTDSSQRASVQFGENMRTGCLLRVTNTSLPSFCALLQEAIIAAIEGVQGASADNSKYVATFGDSDVSKIGDWIPVFYQGRPTPQPAVGLLCQLSLGAHIQFLYANVGSLANPQSKIIGAFYTYQSLEDVTFRCVGPFCQPGQSSLVQKIEVSSSVSFLDVSVAPTGIQAEAPVFIAKVPYDFFFPFLSAGSSPTGCSPFSPLLAALSWLLLQTFLS